MSEYNDFTKDLLQRVASSLGIDYSMLSRDFLPRPIVTKRMLELALSGDRRKWKRAWRLYFKVNGRHAPRSCFSAMIGNARDAQTRKAMQQWQSAIYEEWARRPIAA